MRIRLLEKAAMKKVNKVKGVIKINKKLGWPILAGNEVIYNFGSDMADPSLEMKTVKSTEYLHTVHLP